MRPAAFLVAALSLISAAGGAFAASGGPDAAGYAWSDSNEPGGPTFDWVTGGTPLTTVQAQDEGTQVVAIPFNFPFYGTNRTSVTVGSNGFLYFQGGITPGFGNVALTSSRTAIYPHWDDLNPSATTTDTITAQTLGTSPNQVFIVSWNDVRHFGSTEANPISFQAKLFENGNIEFHYLDVTTTSASFANGLSATVGIERNLPPASLQRSFNQSVLAANMAIRFIAPAANPAPVAEANGPYSGFSTVPVAMSSAGSVDSGGAVTTFSWDCTSDGVVDTTNGTGTGQTCTYPTPGTYTATLWIGDNGANVASDTATVNVALFQGPDAFGYTYLLSDQASGPTFSYVTGGTSLTGIEGVDDGTQTVAIPFNFPFYGTNRTSVIVSSNGTLQFAGPAVGFTNTLPNGTRTAIYPYWDDLNPFATTTDTITAQTVGAAPNRVFIVSWNGVRPLLGTGEVTFQAKLFENGDIEFHYLDVVTASNSNGASATVGIESQTPSATALVRSFNSPQLADNTAVRFIYPATTPPVAEANGPYTVNQGVALTMNSAGSSGAAISNYAWDCTDDGVYDVNNATGTGLACTYPDDGTYTARLRVTSFFGTSYDTATVTVTNTLPTAEANGPYSVNQGVSLTMNAAGSSDTDGTLTLYEWDCESDGNYDVSGATPGGLNCVYPDDGAFTATLRVTDDDGGTATDTASVTVTNTSPSAEANGPYTAVRGVALSMNAGGSADPDGTLVLFEWDCANDGIFEHSSVSSTGINCTYSSLGAFVAALRVTDDDGATATDTASVTVNNDVPIAQANGPYSGPNNTAIAVSAIGSMDPDGGIVSYEWDCANDGVFEILAASPVGSSCTYPASGAHTLALRVTDNDGAQATDTASVNVATSPPSAEANGPYSGVEGSTIAVSALGSTDSNGTIVSYEWDCHSDGVYEVSSTTPGGTTCTYADEGAYVATLRVTDNDGGVDTDIAPVTVTNANPVFGATTVPTAGAEGSSVAMTTSATDVGINDVLSFSWNYGDGSPTQTGTSVSHTYADDGTYTVTRTVTDGDGGTATGTSSIVIANANPTITSMTVPNGNEAEPLSFAATATDPGPLDIPTYVWSFGDGGSASGATVTHAYADNGTYTVTLTVTDGDGGSATQTGTSVVANLPPVIASFAGPSSGAEGANLTYTVAASDPSASDPLTYAWDWGDGSPGASGATASHAYTDNGSYTISVTVTDGDGGSAQASVGVTIANLPPVIDSVTLADGDEGEVLAFDVSATDPGTSDTLSFVWAFGDGSTASGASVTHAYADDGNYTVTVTVTDNDGGSSSAADFVEIWNVAPTVTAGGAPTGPVDEGSGPHSFDATAVDPGTADVITFTWDFGDGSATVTGNPVEHVFADNGSYTVTVTVDDGDGGTDSATFAPIAVDNVSPTITNVPPVNALEDTQYVYDAEATDPGVTDTLNWSLSLDAPAGMAIDASSGLVTWTPTYAQAQAGSASATVTVDDGDGGSDSVSLAITVYTGDADGDGMPDSWEIANNLDPNDPTDAGLDPDGDGMTNLDEFANGTDPATNDAPSMPVLVDPIGGDTVVSLTPTLSLENSTDPQGEILTYEYEIYLDAALTLSVANSGPVNEDASGTTSWQAPSLADNTLHYWTARAWDSFGASDWTEAESFFVNTANEAPPVPELVYPVGGEWAPLSPELTWAAVIDPDGDTVTYDVQVWDSSLAVVAAATGVTGGAQGTWTVDVVLEENTDYLWTARSVDSAGALSDWSEAADFFATGANDPPEGVSFVSPEDESTVSSRSPDLVATEGADPEGTDLSYFFEIDTAPGFDGPDYRTATLPGGWEFVVWSLVGDAIVLPEDTRVYARVQAIDADGLASTPDAISFFVSASNGAPTVPTLLRPEDGASEASAPLLVTDAPLDPEGDPVEVEFAVFSADGLIAQVGHVDAGSGADADETGWPVDALTGGEYTWTARALDDQGGVSEWAAPFRFAIPGEGDDDDDTNPNDCEDCENAGGGASLIFAAPLLALRRRRR